MLASMSVFLAIREELTMAAEPRHREFLRVLTPGVVEIMGVKMPVLRRAARRLAGGKWREYYDSVCVDSFMEEKMLAGLAMSCARGVAWKEYIARVEQFMPMIDNWAVCDTFCGCLGFAKSDLPRFWRFLSDFSVRSTGVYERRFAVVAALKLYAREPWTRSCLELLTNLRSEEYYVSMAIAWGLAECCAFSPERTEAVLRGGCFDEKTVLRAFQKIRESRRVPDEVKQSLRPITRRPASALFRSDG